MTSLSVMSRPTPVTRRGWDPFAEFGDLYERMGRLLDVSLPDLMPREGRSWTPAIDMEETENSYIIEADLPGTPANTVNIDVRGNEVSITADIQAREHRGVMRQQMRRIGRYECTVRLPGEVDAEKSAAQAADGVLQLTLPKLSSTASRHVPVIEAGERAMTETRAAETAEDRSATGRAAGSDRSARQ